MTKGTASARQRDIRLIKQLIWSYFFLLIFEGALRKWVLPSASNLLLVVRDPIVLAAYFLAWRSGIFPRNIFVNVGLALGFVTLVVSLLMPGSSPFVAIYGFRSNFFQLPFIFLIFKVFDSRDVEEMGKRTLQIAIPMGILMAVQFASPGNSWINSGSNDSFGQLPSAMGRIRAPGTFSFITGPSAFFPVVAAFLLYGSYSKRYSLWLVGAAALATVTATVVSGSRGLAGAVAVVFVVSMASSLFLKPLLAVRWVGSLIGIGAAFLLLTNIPIFREGLEVFNQRLINSSTSSAVVTERFGGSFTEPLPLLLEAPLWGYGLGMGTNVGAVLLTGKAQFLMTEGEWGRVLMECGPILGGAFLMYRVVLAGWIGFAALRHTARRDPLALLLFSACFLLVMKGNYSQTTNLGFAVLISGLCLAAMRTSQTRARDTSPETVSSDVNATASVVEGAPLAPSTS